MELKTDQLSSEIEFIVKNEDVDHKGALHICRILRELMGLNDQFVIATFGDLGVYKKLNSSYRLDLTGKARKGDGIRIVSKAIITLSRSVKISVIVYNTGKKPAVIAKGRFAFELQNTFKSQTARSTATLEHSEVV